MTELLPGGLWPVMLTPFHEDGAIDWHGVDLLVDWYTENGAVGLFACCLSSEMYHLMADERLALVQRVVQRAAGRVPVVATGTFGGPLSAQANFIQRMAETGAAAVVIMPNQLVAPEDDDTLLRTRLEQLMVATAPTPLGFYECPSPYKRLLSAELVRWAASSGRYRYIKDTTCEPAAIRAKLAAAHDSSLRLYNANTQSALQSLEDGAAGLSPIAANCYPELFSWLCAHYTEQPGQVRDLQRMLRLMEAVAGIQYPASAKRFLQMRGLPIKTVCRTTTLKCSHDLQVTLESLLETVGCLREELGIG